MAIDREKAFEVSADGFLLEGGAHLSSGVNTPSHVGTKGDRYFKTDDASEWVLTANGNGWQQVTTGGGTTDDVDGGFANAVYLTSQVIDGMGA